MELLLTLFLASAVCFLSGSAWGIFLALGKSNSSSKLPFKICILGFILQSVAIAFLVAKTARIPSANAYELMEFLAWILFVTYLISRAIYRVKFLGIFVSGGVGVFAGLPILCPLFSEKIWQANSQNLTAIKIHALFAILSYAFLAISTIFSVMHILQTSFLKNKKSTLDFSTGLLPLPKLERFSFNWILSASVLMLVSLFFGVFAIGDIDVNLSYLLKFSTGFLVFLMMIILLILSKLQKVNSRAFTKLNVIIFILSILLLIPIQYKTYSL